MCSWSSRGIIQTFDIILFTLNTMIAYLVVKFKMPASLREKTGESKKKVLCLSLCFGALFLASSSSATPEQAGSDGRALPLGEAPAY